MGLAIFGAIIIFGLGFVAGHIDCARGTRESIRELVNQKPWVYLGNIKVGESDGLIDKVVTDDDGKQYRITGMVVTKTEEVTNG